MAELLKEYHPSWIEEPVLPDLPESYARLRDKSPIPISGAEHEYTRWGVKMLMDMGAMDIYQIDPSWGGGISEMVDRRFVHEEISPPPARWPSSTEHRYGR